MSLQSISGAQNSSYVTYDVTNQITALEKRKAELQQQLSAAYKVTDTKSQQQQVLALQNQIQQVDTQMQRLEMQKTQASRATTPTQSTAQVQANSSAGAAAVESRAGTSLQGLFGQNKAGSSLIPGVGEVIDITM